MGNSHVDGSYPGHLDIVTCVENSSSNFGEKTIITGSKDRSIRIWSDKTKKCLVSLGNSDTVTSVVCVNHWWIFSGCADGTIRVWNTRKQNTCSQILEDHSGAVLCLTKYRVNHGKSSMSYVASGSADKTVRIWKIPQDIFHTEMKLCSVLIGHEAAVTSVAFTFPYVISGSEDMTIRIWKKPISTIFSTNNDFICLSVLSDHTAPITALCNVVTGLKTNTLCSASADGKIFVWKDHSSSILSSEPKFEVDKVLDAYAPVHSLGEYRSLNKTLLCAGLNNGKLTLWDASNNFEFVRDLGTEEAGSNICVPHKSHGHITSVGTADLCVSHWDVSSGVCTTFKGDYGGDQGCNVAVGDSKGESQERTGLLENASQSFEVSMRSKRD